MADPVTVIVEVQPPKERQMAIDLPENVAGELLREGVSFHQQSMAETRTNGQHVNNLVRSYAAKSFGHLDMIESRAVSGVAATPIASPAVQTG